MADNQSLKSTKSKTGVYSLKICGICGKRDDKNMTRHNQTHKDL
jgi:hypothetical protein